MNKTVKLKANKIIVTADITDVKRKEKLVEFLETNAKAQALGSATFELDPDALKIEWKDLLTAIDEIIDLRSDAAWIWRFDPEKGELLRTKVAGQQ